MKLPLANWAEFHFSPVSFCHTCLLSGLGYLMLILPWVRFIRFMQVF